MTTNQTLRRIKRVSEYVPVSEDVYIKAIQTALERVQLTIRSTKGVYSKRRAEEVLKHLKVELGNHTDNFMMKFFKDMFKLIWDDTKTMNADNKGLGLYKLPIDFVKNVLGFKEILFTTELKDGSKKHSMISVNALLKSVEADTLKRAKSIITNGAITGVNPNVIADEIAGITDVERRHLRTVVRTMFADAQQRVNMESLKRNQEFYDYYEYSAKLDSRTTKICRHYDDTTWKKFNDIPKDLYPPLHPNCRSTIIGKINL